jgi:hypothetical protein
MLQRVLIDEALEMLFKFARHLGGAPGTRAIEQALRPLPGKALPPFAQSRIREVEGRGNRVHVVACDDLTDRLGAAKDPGLLVLFEHGV